MSVPYRADVQTAGASPRKSITSALIVALICEGEKMAEYIALNEIIEAEDSEGRYEVSLRWLLHCNKATYKTADVVERKKGKWEESNCIAFYILDESTRVEFPLHKCSECKEASITLQTFPQNFCPNCGADMRGRDDG